MEKGIKEGLSNHRFPPKTATYAVKNIYDAIKVLPLFDLELKNDI
jgi:hypothetical protein